MLLKFSAKFKNISKLFNHLAHNGSDYLTKNFFVILVLCVPVGNHDKISYLAVYFEYHMWQKKESKLKLVTSIVR